MQSLCINNIKIVASKSLYSPIEGSSTRFFLKNLPKINFKQKNLLDLGCGSGALGIYYKKKYKKLNVVFSDIKKEAVLFTKINLKLNKLKGLCVCGDLFEKINQRFDLVIFNIPYGHFKKSKNINKYDYKGKIFLRFLSTVKDFLNKNGKIYFTFSNISDRKLLKIKNLNLKMIAKENLKKSKEVRYLFEGKFIS